MSLLYNLLFFLLIASTAWAQSLDQQRMGFYVASKAGTDCSQATLAAADANAFAANQILVLPPNDRFRNSCQWVVSSALTLQSPLLIAYDTTPPLKVNAAITLTLNQCPLTAGGSDYHIIDANGTSSGTVSYTLGCTQCVFDPANNNWTKCAAPTQSGAGDITDVFNCATGDCNNVSLADGDLLDMSNVNPNTTTEGIRLPQASSCASAIALGQVCIDTDDGHLFIGNGSAAMELGMLDITDVYNCATGDCSSIAMADGDLLDASGVNPNTTTEGIKLPQATSCTSATAEGQICWDTDGDTLFVGDGATAIDVSSPGSGDITDVYNCASGDCSDIAMADGDFLNMSAVNPNTTTEGLRLPQATSCTSATAEGQMCWDTDGDILFVGDGAAAQSIGLAASVDITDVFNCAAGDCSNITVADGDFLNFSAVNPDTTTEGIRLPQASSCASATAIGQLCTDIDDGRLFTGDGTTAKTSYQIDPSAGTLNAQYDFPNTEEPLVSAEILLRPIGNCTVAEESIVAGGPQDEWITCVDTVGDGVTFNYKVTTKISTDTTVKITMYGVNKNASPSGTYTLNCAARAVRPGLDAFNTHNTTGQQGVSFTSFDTQSRLEIASATFTLNGTISSDAIINGQCNVSAVPGQIADIRLSGTAVIELSANSLSD